MPSTDASDVPRDTPADAPRDVHDDHPADAPTDTGAGDAQDAETDAEVDAETDAGMDAGMDVADVATDVASDAPSDARADVAVDAGPSPSGRCTPTVDGRIGADWSTEAILEVNAVPTAWTNNELRTLRVCYDPSNLYLGIEGTVEAMNAIVVYLDRDHSRSGTATGVTAFSMLTDNTGALDNRISAALELNVPGFGAEGAWGTAGFQPPLPPSATSESVGLRLFWPAGGTPDRRADFAHVNGVASNCMAGGGGVMSACEVAIAWTSLFEGPRPATTTVALFARINNSDGSMSANQTLPQDNPAAPQTVNRVLTVDVRP